MGILEKLLKLFCRKSVVLEDPVFGKLTEDYQFWTGNLNFAPMKQQVEILVDAGESGPNDEQRQ